MDESVWQATVTEWNPPIMEVTEVDSSKSMKVTPYYQWTTFQKSESSANVKALNAITCVLSPDEFKRIISCDTAKQAWDILEMTHEGTTIVKKSKVQLLTTRFEEIHMEENEMFMDFYTRLNDIVNSTQGLGDKIPESKVCAKILRSLPERFNSKVTAIQELRDTENMRVEELVGSLQTYELNFKAPKGCLLYTSPSPRDRQKSRMPSSA